MGLNEVKSGKEPDGKSLNKKTSDDAISISVKIDSVMAEPNRTKLSDAQKNSILSDIDKDKDLNGLYIGDKLKEKAPYHESIGGAHPDDIRNYTLSKFFTMFFQEITGFGVTLGDVSMAHHRDFKLLHNLGPTYDENAKKVMKEVYDVEPTNENILKIVDGKMDLKTRGTKAEEQFHKDRNNIGEGFGDLISGISAFTAYTKSIGAGKLLNKTSFGKIFGLTALVGGAVKTLITMVDDGINAPFAESYNKHYDDYFWNKPSRLLKSFAMGAFSGILAPITGAIGGRVASKAAFKAGLKVANLGTDEAITKASTKGLKNMLLHPGGYDYSEGAKMAVLGIYGLELATDGALGGAVDCGFRTAVEGGSADDIKNAAVQGGICGAIFSPFIGGMFKSIASNISTFYGFADKNLSVKMYKHQVKSKLNKNFKDVPRTKKELKIIKDGFFRKKQGDEYYYSYQKTPISDTKIKYIKKLCENKNFSAEDIAIIAFRDFQDYDKAYKLIDKMIAEGGADFTPKKITAIFDSINESEKIIEFADKLFFDKHINFPKNKIPQLLTKTIDENVYFVEKLCTDKKLNLTPDEIIELVSNINPHNAELLNKALHMIKTRNSEINVRHIPSILNSGATIKQIKRLYRVLGKEKSAKITNKDVEILAPFANMYGVKNINEIPIQEKKALLRALVDSNIGMFELSDEMRKAFPLIPKNQEEYCSLLPTIVRSMGIETKKLNPKESIIHFHQSTNKLANSLKELSDKDFAKLSIKQEYSREDFIRTVLEKVKGLSRQERQKVYDYFGFELHHSKVNETGYTITGYPANLNNGNKLTQIDDEGTRAVIESLRGDIIHFSEKNRIICENKEVEKLLNNLTEALPEMRIMVGKSQHGSHDYDVMKHSLKVFQKVSQNPAFGKLSESDKKVMTLASFLHDITKSEGLSDHFHAKESSFDAFYIAKKFDLSREEEIKLYKLIKHHEWLSFVNTAKSQDDLTKRLQSVAYDLQQDNLFDLSLMFTHADLKAVKKDNMFHDKTIGRGRVAFKGNGDSTERVFGNSENGTVKSFGESADIYAGKIRKYVEELQKTQPLLPVTKMPKASMVRKAITHVNTDGSTNIKGVYISKEIDGRELVVIKFNEVENWEAIGLPAGSTTKGYKVPKYSDDGKKHFSEAETGNIKFFVHGLDYENQLAKFDAFSLVDSDVLLSVSYAERPETKYRFFRTQGVMLNAQTKYIHGGGNTDAGSGCRKFIDEIKKNYIFGGHREQDRFYISDLIKKATGMNDKEYVKFVKANADKSMIDIKPVEVRDKIIKAFGTINSNVRIGNREYNEIYISNPDKVMGTYTYNENYNQKIGNPIEWLKRTVLGEYESKLPAERTSFLRKYSIDHDVPMYIFGD